MASSSDIDGVDRGSQNSRPGDDRDQNKKKKNFGADSRRLEPPAPGDKPKEEKPKDKKNQGNRSDVGDLVDSLAPYLASGRQKHKGRTVLLGLSDDAPSARVILLGG